MIRKTRGYPHADLTHEIIGAFYDVYHELRSGFRESVYERAMVLALRDRNIPVQQQAAVRVTFRGRSVGLFRADLVVGATVLVELKALPAIERDHVAQVLNALRDRLGSGPDSQLRPEGANQTRDLHQKRRSARPGLTCRAPYLR